jgi:hypothetical protein
LPQARTQPAAILSPTGHPHGKWRAAPVCYNRSEYGQAAHLYRRVPQYGATRLGLCRRAPCWQVRPLVHRAIAMRGSAPRRRCRYRYHPGDRVPAHRKRDCAPRHGRRREGRSSQHPCRGQKAHRNGKKDCPRLELAQLSRTRPSAGQGSLENSTGVYRIGARPVRDAETSGRGACDRRSRTVRSAENGRAGRKIAERRAVLPGRSG